MELVHNVVEQTYQEVLCRWLENLAGDGTAGSFAPVHDELMIAEECYAN